MANKDQPTGARPVGTPLRVTAGVAASAIYPGDFVKLDSAGKISVAAASDALCGVAASLASADGDQVLIFDHPQQQFTVQADEADVDAQTDINLNFDIVATAGDSTYKVSRHELDSSTGAVTATLPLKLLRIEPKVDNALGAQVDCVVCINNHQLAGGTGTAGV